MNLSQSVLQWLYRASYLLAIAGVVFLAAKINQYITQLTAGDLSSTQWLTLLLLSILYGTANLALASAWRLILRQMGVATNLSWAIKIYGISQINKYIPGNIFHLAGRHAMGMAAGIPAAPLAKSALWELILLCFIAIVYSVLAAPLVEQEYSLLATISTTLALLTIAFFILLRTGVYDLAFAALWQAGFLLVSSLVFSATLAMTLNGTATLPPTLWPSICGAYVLAWLAGLATPGAPAGLGVREALLLLLLGGLIPAPELLLAIILTRMITACGDLLFYLLAISKSKCEAMQ